MVLLSQLKTCGVIKLSETEKNKVTVKMTLFNVARSANRNGRDWSVLFVGLVPRLHVNETKRKHDYGPSRLVRSFAACHRVVEWWDRIRCCVSTGE